uniref:SS18 N-terminal domain-containing protein n=1 Tax=Sciurus vulgaris TaxID=55149 RepID=A0A8D2JPI9_SCIVU
LQYTSNHQGNRELTGLICCIEEYQNKGLANECIQYQFVLHRNLIFLATIADASIIVLRKQWDDLLFVRRN